MLSNQIIDTKTSQGEKMKQLPITQENFIRNKLSLNILLF